ncbi:MAG: hypothetical protein LBP59_12015 [Planctomycetaceae bacterium]|nr:hypothetical protein [Planctomycetaceae bacterium]
MYLHVVPSGTDGTNIYCYNKSILYTLSPILLILEIQRFKSVKACRPKARQAKVNANSSTNSLKLYHSKIS